MSNVYSARFVEVWDNQLGVCLRVGPDDDIGSLIQISTTSGRSQEHFGKTRLVMDADFAIELAKAILEVASQPIIVDKE